MGLLVASTSSWAFAFFPTTRTALSWYSKGGETVKRCCWFRTTQPQKIKKTIFFTYKQSWPHQKTDQPLPLPIALGMSLSCHGGKKPRRHYLLWLWLVLRVDLMYPILCGCEVSHWRLLFHRARPLSKWIDPSWSYSNVEKRNAVDLKYVNCFSSLQKVNVWTTKEPSWQTEPSQDWGCFQRTVWSSDLGKSYFLIWPLHGSPSRLLETGCLM